MDKITVVTVPTKNQVRDAFIHPDYTVHFVLKDENGTEYEATGDVNAVLVDNHNITCFGRLLSTDWPGAQNLDQQDYQAQWSIEGTGWICFYDHTPT